MIVLSVPYIFLTIMTSIYIVLKIIRSIASECLASVPSFVLLTIFVRLFKQNVLSLLFDQIRIDEPLLLFLISLMIIFLFLFLSEMMFSDLIAQPFLPCYKIVTFYGKECLNYYSYKLGSLISPLVYLNLLSSVLMAILISWS